MLIRLWYLPTTMISISNHSFLWLSRVSHLLRRKSEIKEDELDIFSQMNTM